MNSYEQGTARLQAMHNEQEMQPEEAPVRDRNGRSRCSPNSERLESTNECKYRKNGKAMVSFGKNGKAMVSFGKAMVSFGKNG